MNMVVVALLILVPIQIVLGYRSGLVKGIQKFIGWITLGLVFVLAEMMLRFYRTGNQTDTLICLILLVIVLLVWRVIRTMLLPAKMLSKLPVIKGVDKLFGVILGILEVMILLWLLDALLLNYTLGNMGAQLNAWMQENVFLHWMYENNYLLVFEKWAEERLIARF